MKVLRKTAKGIVMREERMVPSFDGVELAVTIDTPENPKAVVVIVHGLCEHMGRYQYLTDKLLEHNIKVYRFDHRGHGKSGGKRYFYSNKDEIIDDTNFITDIAITENPQLCVFMIGHSMGGFAAAAYGTKYPGKIRGLVISGGVTRDNNKLITAVGSDVDPDTEFPNELGDGVCSDPNVVYAYGLDPLNGKFFTAGLCQSVGDGIRWLTETKTFDYPVLLMHGAKDSLVNPQDTLDFFSDIQSKDKEMLIFGDSMHEVFNEFIHDEVIADAIDWIEYRI